MGYALCTSECFGCHRLFSYNPLRVPSVPYQGTKHPICLECVKRANPLRVANGLPEIVPLPDAYEACDERELG